MGATQRNIGVVVDDLKHSNYFRVWSFFWLVCFLTAFAGMIMIAKQAQELEREESWTLGLQEVKSMYFPDFSFRFSRDQEANETFAGTPSCVRGGINVLPIMSDDKRRFIITGSNIEVNNEDRNWGGHLITCKFKTNVIKGENQILIWEANEKHTFGSRLTQAVHFEPRQAPGVEIRLRQIHIHPMKGDKNGFHFDGKEIVAWEKDWVYHTTVYVEGEYTVTIALDSFYVRNFDEIDEYEPAMAVGSIGGFWFWMILLHTLVMVLFGFCLTNDSKFLTKNDTRSQGYEDLENKPMLG
jgi:hypothetical protein